MTIPDRTTLLLWFDTLPTKTLRRLWTKVMADHNRDRRAHRRHELERAVTFFRSKNPRANLDQWKNLARELVRVGLYSRKSTIGDIVERLKKL